MNRDDLLLRNFYRLLCPGRDSPESVGTFLWYLPYLNAKPRQIPLLSTYA